MNKPAFESAFPPFPNDIITGVAREFVDLYKSIRETPEAFLWLSFITYLGNAISPYVRLDCASSEPRFFGVVIGKSGRTRKSAGNNAARDFFKQVEPKDQRIIEGFGSAEGMLATLGDSASPKPAILHLDEMNVLASKTDIAGSVGVSGFHKLFEDHDYDHPLAKGNHKVRNAYLSLVGASTLEDFTNAWSAQHKDAGFFSRLLIVAGDVDKRIPRPLDPKSENFDALVNKVKALVSLVAARPRVLTMDEDADNIWAQFYSSFGDGPEWNRIDVYGCRLMALQAILRDEQVVTKENVKQIVEFLQYEVAVREAVCPIIAENPVAQMEELIRRHFPKGMTMSKRDLQRKTNYTRHGIEAFDRAVSNMVRNHEVTPPQESGKSVLYTRIRDNEDCPRDANDPKDVVSNVIVTGEDNRTRQSANENAQLQCKPVDCLQSSVRSPGMKEFVM